jgi:hypothetical protein
MATTNSSAQTDLTPPGGRPFFRKLACRSDACGEVLMESVVRTSTPAHDRQALLMRNGPPWAGLASIHGSYVSGVIGHHRAANADQDHRPRTQGYEHPGDSPCVAAEQSDEADEGRMDARDTMELGPSSRTVVTVRGHRRSRPSQLIASVRPTRGGSWVRTDEAA